MLFGKLNNYSNTTLVKVKSVYKVARINIYKYSNTTLVKVKYMVYIMMIMV